MSEQFSILIDSRTRFETSEPGGVWLSMPTTKEQLHEAMQRVGITADNPQDFFINGFANTEQQPFDVPLPVIQSAGLDELNYLGNLLAISSQKNLHMSRHILHTSPKTIRGRLLSYLSFFAQKEGNYEFDIPFDRQQLADYLGVDRSALSNELSKMQREGILSSKKNHFKLTPDCL